jgi:hypothetical protein
MQQTVEDLFSGVYYEDQQGYESVWESQDFKECVFLKDCGGDVYCGHFKAGDRVHTIRYFNDRRYGVRQIMVWKTEADWNTVDPLMGNLKNSVLIYLK